jgi:hypothetical protein
VIINKLYCIFTAIKDKVYCLIDSIQSSEFFVSFEIDTKADSSNKNLRKFVKKIEIISKIEGVQGYDIESFNYTEKYLFMKVRRNRQFLTNFDPNITLNCPHLLLVY